MSVARGKQGTTVRVGAVASELSRKASYLGRKASYKYWARTHVLMSLPRTAQNARNAPRFTPQSKVARRLASEAAGQAARSCRRARIPTKYTHHYPSPPTDQDDTDGARKPTGV